MTNLSEVKLCTTCKFHKIYGGGAICSYFQWTGNLKASRAKCLGGMHRDKSFDYQLAFLVAEVARKLDLYGEAEEAYKNALDELEHYRKNQLGLKQ